MDFKYELNLKLYEILAKLANFNKWTGAVALRNEITNYKSELNEDIYNILEYGVLLISTGVEC